MHDFIKTSEKKKMKKKKLGSLKFLRQTSMQVISICQVHERIDSCQQKFLRPTKSQLIIPHSSLHIRSENENEREERHHGLRPIVEENHSVGIPFTNKKRKDDKHSIEELHDIRS